MSTTHGLGLGARSRLGQRQQEVVQQIKEYILRNQLKPGDLLPTEAELCEGIGASRSSVREAVKTLAALDIVEVRHGHGTYVGGMSMAALVESLAFRGLLSGEGDHDVLEQVVVIRQTLEQGLAETIVSRLDDEQRESLREISHQMRLSAARGEDFLDLDRSFHMMLMEPLDNELILQLTGAFWQVQALVAPTLGTEKPDLIRTADAHVAIVDAANAGDVVRMREAIAEHYAPVRALITAARLAAANAVQAPGPGSARAVQ